jgi:5-methylcytosine-specific restriction endonuclease McrA
MRAGQRIYVYVELGRDALPIRIFRNQKASLAAGWRQIYPRTEAVGAIRHQIFLRSKGECELCPAPVTESSGHMHEKIHRGKGGEISLENSVFICPTCHRHAHADRNPRFGENK